MDQNKSSLTGYAIAIFAGIVFAVVSVAIFGNRSSQQPTVHSADEYDRYCRVYYLAGRGAVTVGTNPPLDIIQTVRPMMNEGGSPRQRGDYLQRLLDGAGDLQTELNAAPRE